MSSNLNSVLSGISGGLYGLYESASSAYTAANANLTSAQSAENAISSINSYYSSPLQTAENITNSLGTTFVAPLPGAVSGLGGTFQADYNQLVAAQQAQTNITGPLSANNIAAQQAWSTEVSVLSTAINGFSSSKLTQSTIVNGISDLQYYVNTYSPGDPNGIMSQINGAVSDISSLKTQLASLDASNVANISVIENIVNKYQGDLQSICGATNSLYGIIVTKLGNTTTSGSLAYLILAQQTMSTDCGNITNADANLTTQQGIITTDYSTDNFSINSAAGWNAGTLSNTQLSGNSVVLNTQQYQYQTPTVFTEYGTYVGMAGACIGYYDTGSSVANAVCSIEENWGCACDIFYSDTPDFGNPYNSSAWHNLVDGTSYHHLDDLYYSGSPQWNTDMNAYASGTFYSTSPHEYWMIVPSNNILYPPNEPAPMFKYNGNITNTATRYVTSGSYTTQAYNFGFTPASLSNCNCARPN